MSRINRIPRGLQELVGNTSQGKNPDELSNLVSPTVDIEPFWSVDRLEMETDTATVTTPGNGLIVTVPEGEIWDMVGLSARITGLNVGDTVRMGLYMIKPGNIQQGLKSSPTYVCTDFNARHLVSYVFDKPFLMPSGWQLWFLTDELIIVNPTEVIAGTWTYRKILA